MDQELNVQEVPQMPSHNICFYKDDKQMGILDFNGPKMTFDGDMEESAKLFLQFLVQSFNERLIQERDTERKELELELLKLKGKAIGADGYMQGRWDLIGEMQDIILARLGK